ncbi:MAG: right-handed parallel beta-helix repeat-containing protein [Candidatus Thermoplasmatota archaeon]|nr:right-handed parallel beta-helix repeat-containing protein [Candidatus Thermoplasmatota archaeon]
MMRRSLVVVLFLLCASLAGMSVLPSAQATVLFVGGAGPGNYTTIQDAINASTPGDTVYVYSGTYCGEILVNKALTLRGEGALTTTIDACGSVSAVTILADSVHIRDFTIVNGTDGAPEPPPPPVPVDPGISVIGASDCLISNNVISDNLIGILLWEAHNCVISNNSFSNNTWAIRIRPSEFRYSSEIAIRDNIFRSSTREAIFADSLWQSTITNNTFEDGHGIFLYHSERVEVAHNDLSSEGGGIIVYFSYGNTVTDNTISNPEWTAINIWGSNNLIARNRITNSDWGISLYLSCTNTIRENDIIGNKWGIILYLDEYEYWHPSVGNVFYHNNFVDNTNHACDSGYDNEWDNGYPSGGNYWSDYSGPDEFSGPNQTEPGSDGFGDTPRVVDVCPNFPYEYVTPQHNEDRYPLMEPYVVPQAPPSRPQDLQATAGIARIVLDWHPPRYDGGSPITNYSIYRSYAPGTETLLVEIGNVTTYVDTGLELGKTYHYRVAARNAIGEGARSNEASATVLVALKPPLDLIRVPGFENNTVSWTPPGGGGGSRICGSAGHEDCVREVGNVSSRRSSSGRTGG